MSVVIDDRGSATVGWIATRAVPCRWYDGISFVLSGAGLEWAGIPCHVRGGAMLSVELTVLCSSRLV